MKKLLILLAGFVLFSQISTVKALSIEPSSGLYDSDTTFEVELKANPSSEDQNAVSVRLQIENGEFVSFDQASGENWIGITKDCDNGEFFSATNVCLSIAKTTAFEKDENLGTIVVKITGDTAAKITKIEGNQYSNGETSSEDTGDLALYYTSTSVEELNTEDYANTNLSDNTSSLAIIFGVFLLIITLGIAVFIVMRKRNSALVQRASSKTKVVGVVLTIIAVTIVTAIIGISINNNQAINETGAYEAADCPSGTYQKTIGGSITCQCSNSSEITLNPGASNNLGCYPGSCPSGTTKKIAGGTAYCQCNNASEVSLGINSGSATGCYVGSCPSGTTKKVGGSGAYCQCNNASEIALNLNAANSNACGGSGTGGSGSGSGSDTGSGTGTGTGSGSETGGSGSGSSGGSGGTVSAKKAVCGESCNTDSDCALTGFGIKAICNANKKCASPACPTDTQAGSQCGCKTATSTCGQKCGIWDEGFQPLCGDGVSTCSWINGPTCGGKNKTYCMPKAPGSSYTAAACTNNKDASGYKYLIDPTGKPITTQAQIVEACQQVATTKKCYRCTVVTTDGNTCESTDVPLADACPVGYNENSSCNVTAGGNCPVEDTEVLNPCGNMDSNGDGKLTVIDLASFAQVFNTSCSNVGAVLNSCGSRDVKSDGMIDITDFAAFGKYYEKDSCAIN